MCVCNGYLQWYCYNKYIFHATFSYKKGNETWSTFFLSQPKSEVNYVFLNTSSSLKQPNQGRAASNDYIHSINLPIIFSIVWSDFVW